jgi:ABC-2 type transport system ATP-binding protein
MTRTTERPTLVTALGLSKQFAGVIALDNFTASVAPGEIVGLLGPNGAGKTTLIRLLLGFLRPTTGCARIDGLDCYADQVKVHRQVAYMPGEARLFRTMRGRDVIKFFSSIRADGNSQQAQEIARRLDLDLSRWVAFMSTGMRQKLALAVTFSCHTPLMILDEPTSNLDPTVRRDVLELVTDARRQGRTIIFSSHVLNEVEEVCDRVWILRAGRLAHEQTLAELKKQHRIRARLNGPLPEIPAELKSRISIQYFDTVPHSDEVFQSARLHHDAIDPSDGGWVGLETSDDLSPILRWLSTCPLTDVFVQPVTLRTVYDLYHHDGEFDSPVNPCVLHRPPTVVNAPGL